VSTFSSSRGQIRHSLFCDGPLEPLSVRLLQAAGVLSLLLILVVANSLLNGGSGESPFNPNPVAAAAQRTQEVDGMRLAMKIRTSAEGRPDEVVSADGAYNGETGLTAFTYHVLGGSRGTPSKFEAVMDEDAWYFRYPTMLSRMPEGKEWLMMKPLLDVESDNSMPTESPESALRMMSVSGGLRSLANQRVRGVQTKGYALDVQMTAVVAKLREQGQDDLADACEKIAPQVGGPIHIKAFIGGDEIVRRLEETMTVLVDGVPSTTQVQMDMFGLGAHPRIQLPPSSQVYDITPLLEEGVDALGQPS
jgi:hypothetical protein